MGRCIPRLRWTGNLIFLGSKAPLLYFLFVALYWAAVGRIIWDSSSSAFDVFLQVCLGLCFLMFTLLAYSNPGVVNSSNMAQLKFPSYIEQYFKFRNSIDSIKQFSEDKFNSTTDKGADLAKSDLLALQPKDLKIISKSGGVDKPEKKPEAFKTIDFSDKMFDGLRDEDRERTEFEDEGPHIDVEMSVNMDKGAEKPNEKVDSSVIHIPASLELDLYKHFCPTCNVDQPIRTKHCKDCGVCVATFDHHCIWAGNCVGEYNRPFYFIFLNTQLISLGLLAICPLTSPRRPDSLVETISFYFVLTLFGGIFFGLAGLLYYHYKFLLTNVTTWEHLKWNDISYLTGYSMNSKPPFSLNCMDNVRTYFRPRSQGFWDWVPIRNRNSE